MLPFGYRLHGEVEPVDGAPIRTQFLVVGWVPVMPIASWYGGTVVVHQSLAGRAVEYVSEETEHGVRRSLHAKSVIFGQLRGGGAVAAAVIVVLLLMQLGEAPPWGQDATVALLGALAALLGALVASVPLGRPVDPRDAAIRRAIGSVIGVPADLAFVDPLDARRWKAGSALADPGRGGTPQRRAAASLARARLELALHPGRRAELEAETDRLLAQLRGAEPIPEPPAPDEELDDDDDDLPEDPAALVALLDEGGRREDAAEEALVGLGAAAAPHAVAALGDRTRSTRAELVLERIGAPAVPALLDGVRRGSAEVAEEALRLLCDLKAAGTTAALLERHRTGGGGPSLELAAEELAEAHPEAFGVLQAAAEAGPADMAVLESLGRIDEARATPVLLELARRAAAADPAASARESWSCLPLDALGGLSSPAVAPLVDALGWGVPAIREAALVPLSGTTDPAGKAAFEEACAEDDARSDGT